jgi:hypothetical protein
MMKELSFLLLALMTSMIICAQGQQQKFSPEKFDAELQQFIVQEAHLTPQESARFFPVFKEMQRKQRMLYHRKRMKGSIKPQDEEGCQRAIREFDEVDVELKRIQQTYHNKFLDILPASKVYDIIEAEDLFHRRMLKRWSKPKE